MNNLYTYIAATKGETNELKLVGHESVDTSYKDQGIDVDCTESLFTFSNGVIIKYCIESELFEANEQVCPECWISYEVVSELGNTLVQPKRKTFINHCQESFWLKINKQHANI